MKFTRTGIALVLAATALLANAVPLKTDLAHSSVTATFVQMNVPVESPFTRFTAQIDYDAAHPEKASARVDIDTASLDVGGAEYNKEIAGKEWFDSGRFPKASFVSTAIRSVGPGKLNVSGKLTIKGRTQDVSFPLSVKPQGGKQVFEGKLPIRRLAFNVGEGEWKDTSVVADEVVIKFHVAASQ